MTTNEAGLRAVFQPPIFYGKKGGYEVPTTSLGPQEMINRVNEHQQRERWDDAQTAAYALSYFRGPARDTMNELKDSMEPQDYKNLTSSWTALKAFITARFHIVRTSADLPDFWNTLTLEPGELPESFTRRVLKEAREYRQAEMSPTISEISLETLELWEELINRLDLNDADAATVLLRLNQVLRVGFELGLKRGLDMICISTLIANITKPPKLAEEIGDLWRQGKGMKAVRDHINAESHKMELHGKCQVPLGTKPQHKNNGKKNTNNKMRGQQSAGNGGAGDIHAVAGGNRKPFRGRCHNCNQTGHLRKDCPRRRRGVNEVEQPELEGEANHDAISMPRQPPTDDVDSINLVGQAGTRAWNLFK